VARILVASRSGDLNYPSRRTRLRSANPTPAIPTSNSAEGSGNDDRQSEGDSLVEQSFHRGSQCGDATDVRNAGLVCGTTFWVGSAQTFPFVVLGRPRFRNMLSLRWSAGAFKISHPWPFRSWCGVRTSNFPEGLFRSNINPSVFPFP
jgi:hypothetical protein